MQSIENVLIVDHSPVARMFVERIMLPHCRQVRAVEGPGEALRYLSEGRSVDLVISGVHLETGDGFALLRDLSAQDNPPAVLLITCREIDEADRNRAREQGAIGFLRKPVRVRDILSAWKETAGDSRRGVVRLPGNNAVTVTLRVKGEENEPLAETWVYDLSPGGFFVVTEGPIPPGTLVELRLDDGGETLRVHGEIVRVQEPSWSHPGGVAIRFEYNAKLYARLVAALALPQKPARRSAEAKRSS